MAKNKKHDKIKNNLKKDNTIMEIMNIKQGNPIPRAIYSRAYKAPEHKMAKYMIIAIRKKYSKWKKGDDTTNLSLDIKAKDYADTMRISIKEVYRNSLLTARRIMENPFQLQTETGWELFGWINGAEYENGVLHLELHHKIIPYVLDLPPKFTEYSIENIIRMNTDYGIRIYDFLRECLYKKQPIVVTIEEIKKFLGLEKKKSYVYYDRLKERVIVSALKDINENTDIKVNFKEIKEGKKVISLAFTSTEKSKISKMEYYKNTQSQPYQQPQIQEQIKPQHYKITPKSLLRDAIKR